MHHLRSTLVSLYHTAWESPDAHADELSPDRKALIVLLTLISIGACIALVS